ncbi:hypothetical protein [Cecembia lonarensis]|nr:hypothetical protein [Cecembia lonarensis]
MITKIRDSRLLALTPFLVWCMVLWNGLSNRHYHVDANGQVISHAHPVQQGEEDHQHSEEELIFWDLISNPVFQVVYPEVNIPENIVSIPNVAEEVYTNPLFESLFLGAEFLRGPPVLS